ncbi:MAG: CHAT domain-containing protein, partial [Ottowia sp.]|nr:CHAT domain-containing protein [Ottowia sp.]
KAEALQKTQLAVIEGRVAAELTEAARARGRQTDAAGKTLEAAGANHPYYWAPFILMGNWL